ncbi:MAG: hypothetical protein U5Q44_04490 [Dehalococcoidia bacterium]|nr:hypothetical protein [Dehalococcoidia bacterium]
MRRRTSPAATKVPSAATTSTLLESPTYTTNDPARSVDANDSSKMFEPLGEGDECQAW